MKERERGRNQSLLSSSEEGEGQINKRRGEMLMILGRWRKDGPVIKGLFIGKQVTNNGSTVFSIGFLLTALSCVMMLLLHNSRSGQADWALDPLSLDFTKLRVTHLQPSSRWFDEHFHGSDVDFFNIFPLYILFF